MAISLRKAINDRCKECGYDPLNGGTWRQQIEACTCAKSCALWPVRPTSKGKGAPKGEQPAGLREYRAKTAEKSISTTEGT